MSTKTDQEIKQRFQNDILNHVMTIKHDDGVFREIEFGVPGEGNLRFRLVTWGWHLCVNGDMGTYVFCRTEDMFSFFRQNSDELKINPGYWSEKVVSSDRSGVEEFSGRKTAEGLRETVEDFIKDNELSEANAVLLREDFECFVIDDFEDDERGMIDAANGYEWNSDSGDCFSFSDVWEYVSKEYTYRFLWNLYAIVWGIQQYDKLKARILKDVEL